LTFSALGLARTPRKSSGVPAPGPSAWLRAGRGLAAALLGVVIYYLAETILLALLDVNGNPDGAGYQMRGILIVPAQIMSFGLLWGWITRTRQRRVPYENTYFLLGAILTVVGVIGLTAVPGHSSVGRSNPSATPTPCYSPLRAHTS